MHMMANHELMFIGERLGYIFKAVCVPNNLLCVWLQISLSTRNQVDLSGESLLDNVPESDALAAVFFLGKVLGTYLGDLIFYSPSMQLTHWYGWGKLPNQQYPSSLV